MRDKYKIEAPRPFCRKCNINHETIPWFSGRNIFRCPNCNTYGGPVLIFPPDPPASEAIEIPDPEEISKNITDYIVTNCYSCELWEDCQATNVEYCFQKYQSNLIVLEMVKA